MSIKQSVDGNGSGHFGGKQRYKNHSVSKREKRKFNFIVPAAAAAMNLVKTG